MSDLIEEFCTDYHAYNDISAERRKMQVRVLRALEARVGTIEAAGAEDVSALLSLQRESGLSPNTVRKHLGAIRPFFSWGRKRKPPIFDAETLMDVRDLRPPRGAVAQGVPRPYTRKEVRWFWREFDAKYPAVEDGDARLDRFLRGQSRWKKRLELHATRVQMLAIVSLALQGGLRRDEIFNLGLDDVHPDNDYVVVRHAARKNKNALELARAVPWMADMHAHISAWLALRERLAPDHDALWLSLYQHHNRKALRHDRFKDLLHDIRPGWEFHRMRHTFATEYLRNDGKLHTLQKIMGHARLQQTLAYAQLLKDDIVRDAARVNGNFSQALGKDGDGEPDPDA